MKGLVFVIALVALLSAAAGRTKWHQLEGYTFEKYVKEFGKRYADAKEVVMRKQLFEAELETVRAHNKGPSTYKKGVNHFSDRTLEEKRRSLGLDRAQFYHEMANEVTRMPRTNEELVAPLRKDWRDDGIISDVKNQFECGSCWTFGTTETVESYWALATGELPVLSEQAILDCTPNPQQCGGTGGCGGGTAKLAVDTLVALGGQPSEWLYPYLSAFGNASTCKNGTAAYTVVAKVATHRFLAANSHDDVIGTLATTGPLITNVDASSWHAYESGVYDGCSLNATIDHVVQMVGYGHDAESKSDYYLIRNSWSPAWGEAGYIRLKRQGSSPRCGYDNKPQTGNTCTGGPDRVEVCGECGVLYSLSYVDVATN